MSKQPHSEHQEHTPHTPHKQHHEEDGGESVGLWYVSFADMITLLLSFFVALSGFSSYSNDSLGTIKAVGMYGAAYAVRLHHPRGRNSLVSPINGLPFPTVGEESVSAYTPALPPPGLPPSAQGMNLTYAARKVIRIPMDRLFLGRSTQLSPDGRRCVGLIAQYLRRQGGKLHLACSLPQEAAAEPLDRFWLQRQWSVAQAVVGDAGLPPADIGLCASDYPARSGGGLPELVITILSEGRRQ